jgi:dipeptidyl aminopeptidase/acylaminoacyl peptidase
MTLMTRQAVTGYRRPWPLLLWGALLVSVPACRGAEDAPSWEALQAPYAYDATLPLSPVEDEVTETDASVRQHVTFQSINGETVPALLIKPKGVDKPPCVFILHGYGGSKDMFVAMFAMFLCPKGYAVFGIDAALHGERKREGEQLWGGVLSTSLRAMEQTVIDCRRALDYLETREDIDASRVGYIGTSMGAIFGAIVCGVEERFRCPVLVVGGADLRELAATSTHPVAPLLRAELEEASRLKAATAHIDPANYVGHISPRPLLMINGRQDRIVPAQCAEALHEAAKDPKEIMWLEADHALQPHQAEAISEIDEWLRIHLGNQ